MGLSHHDRTIADQGPSKSTLWISLWAFTTLLWSIFTVPHKTFPVRILLFQPAWAARIWNNDSTWVQDLGLVLSLHSFFGLLWTRSWTLPTIGDLKTIDLSNEAVQISCEVFGLLAMCGGFAASLVFRGRQLKTKTTVGLREETIEDSILPPLLIPSRTSHSRIFPEKHSFSYSYLFVGVPVGIRGQINNVLSVDSQHAAWFDVRSTDFLDRGNSHLGLGEKLKRYLHTQGVTDREYAFAYLVTAPRFLGYSFNPVSFWQVHQKSSCAAQNIC